MSDNFMRIVKLSELNDLTPRPPSLRGQGE